MRNKGVLIGGATVVGLLAAATSALTATSTIYAGGESVYVGSVAQSVAGVDVLDVNYQYVPATDTTEVVTVIVDQWLAATNSVLQVSVNGGGYENCAAPVTTDDNLNTVDDGTEDFSTVVCDIVDTADVTALRFLVQE
jgi:hypothetical protein